MAYFPRKLRSELTPFTNFSGGRVADTSFMFQEACPASHMPAFNPTRGSGLGGDIDMLLAAVDGGGAVGTAGDVELLQAPAVSNSSEPANRGPARRKSCVNDISGSWEEGHGKRGTGHDRKVVTVVVPGW